VLRLLLPLQGSEEPIWARAVVCAPSPRRKRGAPAVPRIFSHQRKGLLQHKPPGGNIPTKGRFAPEAAVHWVGDDANIVAGIDARQIETITTNVLDFWLVVIRAVSE
jgi:hypothetical protein